jgi:hypothetical protein
VSAGSEGVLHAKNLTSCLLRPAVEGLRRDKEELGTAAADTAATTTSRSRHGCLYR